MKTHMLQYTLNAEQVAKHEELLRDAFAGLEGDRPPGLRYSTFKLADGVSFVHLISHDKAGHGPLPRIEALRDAHAGIRERCVEPPVRTELSEIGEYRS